jgi:restriction system protein
MTATWMVRAGRGGRFFDDFRGRSMVAIGWHEMGNMGTLKTRERFLDAVRAAYPNHTGQAVIMDGGQLYRFVEEFSPGDRVVTYDPRARSYLCGQITGAYEHDPAEESQGLLNRRQVNWAREVSRDDLSESARNSLGAISTIFRISDDVAAELWSDTRRQPVPASKPDEETANDATSPAASADDIAALANEAIKDRVAALSWQDMQELVAGLLRAMGYKTIVSPAGADRGKDIVASPDGFGFQEPRIIVEVKHRRGERMGSQEIRSFLGGRHPKDKGLYVSTGGFSKDAYYEAERANIPLHLLDFEGLVETILEYYPSLDEETKQLVPLRRLYWPIDK